jgi:hypothetical protein
MNERQKEAARKAKLDEALWEAAYGLPAVEQGPIVGSPVDCRHDQGLTGHRYCVVCMASSAWIRANVEREQGDYRVA